MDEKKGVKQKSVKFNRNTFQRFINNNDMQGSGTRDDPFVFLSSDSLPKELELKRHSIYIRFESCEFYNLDLDKSSNISLINCTIGRLRVGNSHDIEVRNSRLQYLEFIYSYNCIIIKSSIRVVYFSDSRANRFEDLDVSPAIKSRLTLFEDITDFTKILYLNIAAILFVTFVFFTNIIKTNIAMIAVTLFGLGVMVLLALLVFVPL